MGMVTCTRHGVPIAQEPKCCDGCSECPKCEGLSMGTMKHHGDSYYLCGSCRENVRELRREKMGDETTPVPPPWKDDAA